MSKYVIVLILLLPSCLWAGAYSAVAFWAFPSGRCKGLEAKDARELSGSCKGLYEEDARDLSGRCKGILIAYVK